MSDRQYPRGQDAYVTLIDKAAKGRILLHPKSGRPKVKVVAIDAPTTGEMRRVGLMAGQLSGPDDLDRMAGEEIEKLFGGGA